ncbi:hypothetical protein SDC9_86735 [bioreactor metagenome]|uniref:NAD-specific glutamate dehydrogenase n=1 Tax=bioreactor metagenome TaxID=1076179 RepID=A0A644ZHA3_9ZZZZ
MGQAISRSGLAGRRRREVHHWRLADFGLVLHGEIGLGLVAHHHGRQVGGEAACEHVVFLHRLDVAVACHGDAVFRAFQRHAQIAECLVGLEFGVALRDHHQARQRAGEFALGLLELVERLGVVHQIGRGLDGGGLGARLDHLGEGLLLEVGLALHRGDDVGHQIGAALVLVEHLAPGGLGLLVQRLELVVAATRQRQRGGDGRDESEEAFDGHGRMR